MGSLSISLLLCTILIPLLILWRRAKKSVNNPPPGSYGWPLIGETLEFIKANNSSEGVYHFVQTRRKRYGNCFKTSILGDTHVFVSATVEGAKSILGSDSRDFSKRYMRSIARLLGEQSLLCASSHEYHQLIRRRIASLFTFDSMASTIKVFDDMTVETLNSWEQSGCVLVLDHALKITFKAICKMLMSIEEEGELEMLQKDVSEVTEAMLAFPLKLPGTRFYRGLQARRRIMNALEKKIGLRRKGLECHEDFLQSLLVMDESPNADPMADTHILDNILTLIIAGQITTASAIAWMVKYLDENMEVQDKLRDLQLQFALRFHGSSIGPEALNEMSYASKVVKESLRMATIVSWFPRVALKDCQIEGFDVKKGWIVNIDARSAHFDPAVYDEPLRFKPTRFDTPSQTVS